MKDSLRTVGDMEIFFRLENGKALLEFSFYLDGSREREGVYADLTVCDREGSCVLRMRYPLASEDPARGLLLHPHLWNGVEDPYLYRVEAVFVRGESGGEILGRLRRVLPLCTLRRIPQKGWALNGEPFPLRAVEYELPSRGGEGRPREAKVLEDLRNMRELGANAVCLRGKRPETGFYELCCRLGMILLWERAAQEFFSPPDAGVSWEALWDPQGRGTDRYYYYRALWSDTPFVYLSGESLVRQENGRYRVTAYSNQKKAALYVDGILFEFQRDAPEFVFFDVEIRRFPVILTVEAGSAGMSVTFYWPSRS